MRRAMNRQFLLAPILLALVSGCHNNDDDGGGLGSSPATSTFAPDVAVAWFNLLYDEVKEAGTNPPTASRIYGYAAVALYEAVVPGMADHQTLQGQLNALPAATIPAPANAQHHWAAAANRALAVVAASFFPGSQATIDALENQFATQFQPDAPADVLTRSSDFGEAVANAVLGWAATDGIAGLAACNAAFVPPVAPGAGGWVGTGLGLLPCWGTLRTF